MFRIVRTPPERRCFRIGMRTVKTVVAVFLCSIIDLIRGVSPIQSTIAAIICIQPDTEHSTQIAMERVLATCLGGISAALTVVAMEFVGIPIPSAAAYFIFSLLLLPLILITVNLGWPSATALTCVVFLVITLSHTGEFHPFSVAGHRIIDTTVGILVALPVNRFLPNHHVPEGCECEESVAPAPDGEAPVEVENTQANQKNR